MKKTIAFLLFVFVTQYVLAEYTCNISASDYIAIYEKDSFTCSAGQYLPADGSACVTCPTGFTCPGGTFDYDSDSFQGLEFSAVPTTQMDNVCATNFPNDLLAVYEPDSYNCSSGYYLPANVDECVACISHGVCPGGTYTFNETIPQGITGCEDGYHISNNVCVANVINITWDNASGDDIAANDAGTVTYGGDIRTPKKAQHINGKIFTGWTFNTPSGN